jgi:cyclic beta-1,2-glucan synthetase
MARLGDGDVALEGILGFQKVGDRIRLDPCIPTAWPGFTLDYRHGGSAYCIEVRNPDGVSRGRTTMTVDGATARDGWITLDDDGARHVVVITLEGVDDGWATSPGTNRAI